jgi:micrococcal nuclease
MKPSARTSRLAVVAVALVALGFTSAQRDASSSHRRDLVGKEFEARVVRVADGDTVEVIPAGESRPVRVRLHGIDAPELGEPFSRQAQAFLRRMVGTAPVRVRGRDVDNYGRLVARIETGGRDTSTALVGAGLACHAYARDAALAREEAQARAAGAGFWDVGAKKPRCVERTAFSTNQSRPPSGSAATPRPRGRSTARPDDRVPEPRGTSPASGRFRGNVSSGVYHAATCPNFNCRNCTRLFASEAEAKMAGFRPAGDCLKR